MRKSRHEVRVEGKSPSDGILAIASGLQDPIEASVACGFDVTEMSLPRLSNFVNSRAPFDCLHRHEAILALGTRVDLSELGPHFRSV